MEQARVARFGGTPFRATIYQEQSLLDRHGHIPARVVARQTSASLRANGADHVISYGFDGVPDARVEGNSGCPDPNALPNWRTVLHSGDLPRVEPDGNLLLMDQDGGGCTAPGTMAGTAPAVNIGHDPGFAVARGTDGWARNVSAALHEIGRLVGVGNSRIFPTHPGMGWNDPIFQNWHRTPNQNEPGITNACGEQIDDRTFDGRDQTVSELYFNGCMFDHWKLEDKPPLEQEVGLDPLVLAGAGVVGAVAAGIGVTAAGDAALADDVGRLMR